MLVLIHQSSLNYTTCFILLSYFFDQVQDNLTTTNRNFELNNTYQGIHQPALNTLTSLIPFVITNTAVSLPPDSRPNFFIKVF